MPFESGDIITALVGLFLVLKGVLDKIYAHKKPDIQRGCLYGDKAHDDLMQKIDMCRADTAKILTILEERR